MIQPHEIINHFTSKFEDCKYLEIGSQYRKNFDLIEADTKRDVDPDLNSHAMLIMTSDEYFKLSKFEFIYDVIFIDGLHHYEQVLKDVYNSSKCLSENGYIILHDCLPNFEIEQLREQKSMNWVGDVWKAQLWLMKSFKNVFTIADSDRGCGIIEGKIDFKLIPEKLCYEWEGFVTNFKEMKQLVTWNEYLNRRKVKLEGTRLMVYEF